MTSGRVRVGVAGRTILQTFGWRGMTRRVRFEVRRQAGLFRREPVFRGPVRPDADLTTYSPNRGYRSLPAEYRERVLRDAGKVAEGLHLAYGGEWRQFPADADAWRTHPVNGFTFDNAPWWRVPHLPAHGDIKDVWEPARFAWAYDLVRAYSLTGDPGFGTVFASQFQTWRDGSPPFFGPHWACGQETAIRALALLHAEAVLVPAVGDDVLAESVRTVLAASGERIEDAIEYGLSQRTNHGISEAAGLIHLGFRFERQHPAAGRWRRRGLRWLAEQIRDQFYPDGWYAQHSLTYMRTALDQAILAQRLLTSRGLSLPLDCVARLSQSVELLGALVCSRNGTVPNHGANDGGRVLTYSSAPYRDFRPALTLAAVVLNVPLPADVPADPEVEAWTGTSPAVAPPRRDGVVRGSSGWAVARAGRTSVFLCAGTFKHRPSHLDSLHIDVRHDGQEVITDPGSFSYNAPPPWNNGMVSAQVHNGPVVNDQEPGIRGPRFLWWAWPSAALITVESEGETSTIVARLMDAVARTPIAERRVCVSPEAVVVEDRALVGEAATVQVTWLLHPEAGPSTVLHADLEPASEAGQLTLSEHRGQEGEALGWFSPTYGTRLATRVVRLRASSLGRGDRVVTRIQFGGGALQNSTSHSERTGR